MASKFRLDLHCHTRFSHDSTLKPELLVKMAQRRGLDYLVITDHNTVEGARRLMERSPLPVIMGEEITSRQGEIIGLFLKETIPPGLTAKETAEAIKEQGGLVYIPHPFDRLRRKAIQADALEEIAPWVDIVEAANSRNLFTEDDEKARQWALARGKALGAGSDAHTFWEVGKAYVEVGPFDGPESFLAALRQGSLGGGRSTLLVHVYTKGLKTLLAKRG